MGVSICQLEDPIGVGKVDKSIEIYIYNCVYKEYHIIIIINIM